MKKLLVVSAMIAVMLPLLAQSPAALPTAANDQAAVAFTQAAASQVPSITTLRRAGPPTGPVPRLPDGTVDLTGVWVGGGPISDLEEDGGLKRGEVDSLLLPWAKALMATRDVTQEPHNQCLPMGVPRTTPFPFRFVQTPTHKAATHIFILHEGNIHSYRQVFMDGRKHPAELDPAWFGHSIGSWEGDTLVIDTVGFNDKFWFDRRGTPHTEQLHSIERWTRLDMGHMEHKLTIDDPGAYSRPFTLAFSVRLSTDDELLEYICQENNQFGFGNGRTNPYAVR